MEKRLPIKFFSKREEDKQRVEGNSNKELPRWVLSGDELQNKSNMLSASLNEIVSVTGWENRTVPVIMQATLNKDAHAKKIVQRILNGTDKDKLLETVVQLETEQQFQAI